MVVAVASPSSVRPSAGRPHPTYKEMVVQALTELREPAGSSRRAIAKYIADHFSGLPARHDALLSVHLRRLRSQGTLLMSGYSYLLSAANTAPSQQRPGRGRPPKTAAAPPPGQKRGPGRPRKNPDLASWAPVPVFQGVKRGPGRPRKNTSSSSPLQGVISPPPPSGAKRGPGRPRRNASPVAPPPPPGVSRGPGRPRKNSFPVASPPPSGVKRGPGRPRRNAIATPVFVPPTAMPGQKRGRGRPPKKAPILTAALGVKEWPLSVTSETSGKGQPGQSRKVAVAVAATLSGKRRPGRPPKSAVTNSIAGARRGRGRPPKVVLPAHSSITAIAMPTLVAGVKRKRGRPSKEKRPPEGPRQDKPMQPGSMQSVVSALTKRGPGRPRKEKTVGAENLKAGGAVVAQMTEAGHEAQPAKTADKAGAIRNGGEVRHLQSSGTSLTQKRGRGRPRKRPLETETTETGVGASMKNPSAARSAATGDVASMGNKRGRGRPRKKNPSARRPAETGNAASMGNKRGRGRPRKYRSVETETAEAAIEVARDLAEGRPEKDEDLVSGKKIEAEGVILGERMEARPTNVGGVLVSGEKVAIAPVEAGGAMSGSDPIDSNLGTTSMCEKDEDLVSGEKTETEGVILRERMEARPTNVGVLVPGEKVAIAPVEAGGPMSGVDPIDSNLDTTSKPEKDEDLVSGKKTETEGVIFGERMEARPADAGCSMSGVDPIDSNLGTTSL